MRTQTRAHVCRCECALFFFENRIDTMFFYRFRIKTFSNVTFVFRLCHLSRVRRRVTRDTKNAEPTNELKDARQEKVVWLVACLTCTAVINYLFASLSGWFFLFFRCRKSFA